MSGSVDMNNRPLLWALINGTTEATTAQAGPLGVTSVTGGTGVHTLTLSGGGADALYSSLRVQVRGGAGNANAQAVWTNDTTLTVTTYVGAVATAAIDFEIEIVAKRAATG